MKNTAQKFRKHVKENHETAVYKAFMTNHFENPDLKIPDSWECTKCRHSKNREIIFISEHTCIEHFRDEHLNEAVDEFAASLK